MQKYLLIISILLLVATLASLLFYPTASPMLGVTSLLLNLVLSTHAIYAKHKGTEHARPKILKEAGVMVLTLIAVIFTSTLLSTSLGGIAAMLANAQVSVRWGAAVGLVSALGASFLVGTLSARG